MYSQSILLILSHLVIPIILLKWVWRGKEDTRLDWLLKVLIAGGYLFFIFLAGNWAWFSYYLRYLYILLYAILVYLSYQKARHYPFTKQKSFKERINLVLNAINVILFLFLSLWCLSGYFYQNQSVQLTFPLKNGTYYIAHGGSSKIINAHYSNLSQRYALDIIKLNSFGSRAGGFYPKDLEMYAIYGETLYSPCSGIVTQARDGFPDLIPPQADRDAPAGNHIIIDYEGKGIYIIIAHLQEGSLLVQEGDIVAEGQPIARVGNSGNTSEPHLHIHAKIGGGEKETLDGIGVVIEFEGKFFKRNGIFKGAALLGAFLLPN